MQRTTFVRSTPVAPLADVSEQLSVLGSLGLLANYSPRGESPVCEAAGGVAGGAAGVPTGEAAGGASVIQIVHPHQHLPRLRPVRRPEHSRLIELIDDTGRASITDSQLALQQRC